MINLIRRLFSVGPTSEIMQTVIPAWKRGTYAENMLPLKSLNFLGTFCRYCGDWIIDSAYYSEHNGHHSAKRGSWNYENPKNIRRDPNDIKPNHQQWLEDMRHWASNAQGKVIGGTCCGIGPYPNQFNSEDEARDTLSPFGFAIAYSKHLGYSNDGGKTWSGGWYLLIINAQESLPNWDY